MDDKPLNDAIIESSKAGVRKPDPRIYLMMCERLGVEAKACIYLDDLGVNCKSAAQRFFSEHCPIVVSRK